jgi:hypothetical protein
VVSAQTVEGRYAAVISGGMWGLHARSDGFVCGEWAFDADLNAPFETSVRRLLDQSLETVDFLDQPLSENEITQRGYRAQITVRQGSAEAGFSASERLLFRDIRSKVSLLAVLSVSDDRGLAFQVSLNGRGTRNREVFGCSSIGEAVAEAAHDALKSIVDEAAVNIPVATRRIGSQ